MNRTIPLQMLALFFCCATTVALIPTQWESRGIGGGGAMFALSLNPDDHREFFAGCDMSELFHSTDGGEHYTVVPFLQANGNHHSTVRFTKVNGLLYTINYKMNGVLDHIVPAKSTDGGATWTMLTGTPDESEATMSIDVDHEHPDRIIISTYGAIYASRDGGTSFTQIHTAANNGAGNVVGGVFFNDDRILIGTNDGLLESTDGGATFAVVQTTGIPAGETMWSFAAGSDGSTTTCVCLTATSDVYVGHNPWEYDNFITNVYTMTLGPTRTWVRRSAIAAGEHPMFCAMAWNNATTMYMGGNASDAPMIKRSTDGGATWTSVFLAANNANIATGWSGSGGDRAWSYGESVFTLAVAPRNAQVVMFGDYGFLHRTTDGGTSWKQVYTEPVTPHVAGQPTPRRAPYKSIGLENTSCWSLCFPVRNTIIGCYTDIKGIISTDGGTQWSFDYSGHDANTMYQCVRDTNATLYAATSNIHDLYQSTRLADVPLDANDAMGKVIKSTDLGHTWTDVHVFGHPVYSIALDPNNERIAYASVVHSQQGGVYVTKDLDKAGASTWTRLPAPSRTEGHPACLVVLKNGNVLCTYSGRRVSGAPTFTQSSGCFLYDVATGTWKDVSDPNMQWWTKDVVVDASDPTERTWYVAVFSGWGGPANGKGGLYRTTDAGTTWKKIFDADRVTSCTIDPENPDLIYATTEVEGLWYSLNGRSATPTWQRDQNFPFRQPERVYFDPFDHAQVWVTTAGNGLRVGRTGSSTDVADGTRVEPITISIAPQPAATWCRVIVSDPSTVVSAIVLRDVAGHDVMRTTDRSLDLTSLASGMYSVHVYDASQRILSTMISVQR